MEEVEDVVFGASTSGVLDLSQRNLIDMHACIFDLGTSLCTLNLSHNGIVHIPKDIARLLNLSQIDLSHNAVEEMHQDFGALKRLKTLDLSHNRLLALPLPITRCALLRQLNVDHNYITPLPQEIGNLKVLTSFSCNNNELENLANALSQCVSLQSASFKGNPKLQEDESVIKGSVPADFLEDAKVIVLACGIRHAKDAQIERLMAKVSEAERELHKAHCFVSETKEKNDALSQRNEMLETERPIGLIKLKENLRKMCEKLCCIRLKVLAEELKI